MREISEARLREFSWLLKPFILAAFYTFTALVFFVLE